MKLELLRAVVAEVSDYCHDASDVSLLGGDGGIDFDAVRLHEECLLLGADGGIDFDAVRVHEECKQSCMVKNKGKYDISFSYVPSLLSSARSSVQSACLIKHIGMLVNVFVYEFSQITVIITVIFFSL